jgi:DNA repair exonuclease SbcCD nuclease subunit
VKYAIISDLHLGVRGDSQTFRNILIDWWNNFLIPTLKKENVDVLNILGDFYDNRNNVNVLTQNMGYLCMSLLEENLPQLQVRIILGNHDIYYRNTRQYHSLKKFERFPNIEVISEITEKTEHGKDFLYVPWLINHDELYTYNKTKKSYDVVFGHFEINGFKMNGGYVEEKGIDRELFKKQGTVFSGHFHKRSEEGNIIYCGNPFHMDWNDAGDDKGIYIYDLTTGRKRFIINDKSPKYMKVYLSQLRQKTVELNSLSGNFIKVFLDTEYTDVLIEKLSEVIRTKNPLAFNIEGFGANDVNTDVDVSGNLDNPLETLLAWVSEIEIGNLDKQILFKKFYEIYERVNK